MSGLQCSGLKIISSDALVEQFRFPRTKKRRIRNKWASQAGNWRPSARAIMDGNGNVYMHPQFAQKLIQQFARQST